MALRVSSSAGGSSGRVSPDAEVYSTMSFAHASTQLVRDTGRSRFQLAVPYSAAGPIASVADAAVIVALSLLSAVLYRALIVGGHIVGGPIVGVSPDLVAMLGIGVGVAAFYGVSVKASRLYEPSRLLADRSADGILLLIWTAVIGLFSAPLFLMREGADISHWTMIVLFVLGVLVLPVFRRAERALLRNAWAAGRFRGPRVLVVGGAEELADSGLKHGLGSHGYVVVRTVQLASPTGSGSDLWDETLDDLVGTVQSLDVDEVFIVSSELDPDGSGALADKLRLIPLPVRLVPGARFRRTLDMPSNHIGFTSAFELRRAPLSAREQLAKRAFDLVFAAAGLVVLAPVFLAIAIAIYAEGGGPILFRQRRRGFSGRVFRIYKFRTMTVLEDGPKFQQATVGDRRVTRVGRWLRRTSLDELPQLLNVLGGEMSLVGPRPHPVALDDEFRHLIADYALRHHVKPGITGWAQVNGFRGETAHLSAMCGRVERDLWYVDNRSLLLDCRILFRTALAVFEGTHTY